MSFKYVGLDIDHGGTLGKRRLVVVFPERETHSIIAKALRDALEVELECPVTIASAGFCDCEMENAKGKSESLAGLKSDAKDADRFNGDKYGAAWL
jgi:hypothetical protein